MPPWHDPSASRSQVGKYSRATGIVPNRLGQRRIGIHSLRMTATNDTIGNEAQLHEVREFGEHRNIHTMELCSVCKEEDGELAVRRIPTHIVGKQEN